MLITFNTNTGYYEASYIGYFGYGNLPYQALMQCVDQLVIWEDLKFL